MGDVIDLKARLSAEVVPLFHGARADEPPARPRKIESLSDGVRAAFEIAGEADRRQQEHIKQQARLERAARKAVDALNGKHVDPSMKLSLAAQMEHVAASIKILAANARLCAEPTIEEESSAFAERLENYAAFIEGENQ